ncbi:MAG: acyltransferase [Clostridia bacterium]|nr:acyltransferase [Clostridia bacterium]
MKKRIDFEIMRIVAILFVLINHTGTNRFICTDIYNDGQNVFQYSVFLMLTSLARIAVPLFFMISGALLIPKKESIKEIMQKRILKYLCIIVVFSGIQYFIDAYMYKNVSVSIESFVEYISRMYAGPVVVPYWFLYSYISVLILLPFFRSMVTHMTSEQFHYLIVLHLIFVSCFQVFERIYSMDPINVSLPLVCETSFFYFIIGYYLDLHVVRNAKKEGILGIIALVSVICSALLVYREVSQKNVFFDGSQYNYSSSLILFPVAFVFLWIKNHGQIKCKSINWFIQKMGRIAFPLYLLERVFDVLTFDVYFISNRYFPPIISWMIWVMASFVLAFILISMYRFIIDKTKGLITEWIKRPKTSHPL